MMQISSAWDSAEGLRELVELAEQHAERVDGMPAGDLAAQATTAPAIPGMREGLEAFLAKFEQEQTDALDALDLAEADLASFERDPIAAAMRLLPSGSFPEVAQRLTGLAQQSVRAPGGTAYLHSFLKAVARRPRRPRVFPAILSAICSEAEQIVANVLRRHFFDGGGWPSLLDPGLDDEVHKRLGTGGSLEKWRQEIESCGAPIKDLVMEWAQLDEVFARRNLFVHRRGVVDARYAKRAPAPAPEIGSLLDLDAQYLRDAIDRVELLTIGMTMGLLRAKVDNFSEMLAGSAAEFGFAAVDAGALLRAEGYYHLAGALSEDQEEKERQRVNAWLARDVRLGPGAVHAEVDAWGADKLPRVFQLARLILLRRDEEGLALFADLVADGTLAPDDVQQWLLFARWRDQQLV
ncbi:hypothetical protein [Streptacidiphilus anmyonensis]|uniref:hypothetical protein n=1 Tax=Streptacidiphilus anmyonensis TaxID=405782 RepID=UPI0005AB5C89|nr:hypothetical protein [Streptacidiphilus anmyonensis]